MLIDWWRVGTLMGFPILASCACFEKGGKENDPPADLPRLAAKKSRNEAFIRKGAAHEPIRDSFDAGRMAPFGGLRGAGTKHG